MSLDYAHVPRHLLITMRLGELPEHLESWARCRREGVGLLRTSLDGGPIDRLLSHFCGAARMARLHTARCTEFQRPGVIGARRFNELEQLSGVARVIRVQVRQGDRLREVIDALSQSPNVESVTAERLIMGMDGTGVAPHPVKAAGLTPDLNEAWRSRELIRLPQALGYVAGDRTVLVGLADTGVDLGHGAINAALRPGFDTVDLTQESMGSMQLAGDNLHADNDPSDEVGHGTGCAGIMSGDTPLLPPGAGGVCSLVPARVLGAALKGERRVGVGSVANIDAGMKRLVDLGVKVINMSFGTPQSQIVADDALPHLEVVRYALAHGVILVAASGNSGLTERYFPAAHPGVIAVGAVDLDMNPARFATRGDHVALCAPGANIWTCGLQGWQRANGTSFAAPFVSAACALLVARADARAWPLSPEQARDLLVQTARPFSQPGVEGLGAGVLDAHAALRALDAWIDGDDEAAAAAEASPVH